MPRDEIGDAGVALPPILVGLLEAAHHHRDTLWPGRLGDVPHFVRAVAERPQEVDLARIGTRFVAAIAHAHHLAPPASPSPDSPGTCTRYLGRFGSVTSTIDVPLVSSFPVRGLS